MKITPCEPHSYEKAPIAEVICQLRFDRILALEKDAPAKFQDSFARANYPKLQIEQPISLMFGIFPNGTEPLQPATPSAQPRLFHFISEDEKSRLTVSADFIALSCSVYLGWTDFHERLTAAMAAFAECYQAVSCNRLGLRYRDVINREVLGLSERPWYALISPMLLGPLAMSALATDAYVSDESITNFFSQATVKLDDCSLLLQGSVLETLTGERNAFLIDSDFFIEATSGIGTIENSRHFEAELEILHTSAGDLFRRCITNELHHALGPRSK